MDRSTLTMKLQAWHAEFSDMSQAFDVPEKFWTFLSSRLVEIGIAEDDPDVVRAQLGDRLRKVKITGRRGPMLYYQLADSEGLGVVPVHAIHREDNAKLADILDALEGK